MGMRAAPSVVRPAYRCQGRRCLIVGMGLFKAPKARAATMVIPTPRPALMGPQAVLCAPRIASQVLVMCLCGDGTIDSADGEDCDDGNNATEACAYGLETCGVCTAGCTQGAGTTLLW